MSDSQADTLLRPVHRLTIWKPLRCNGGRFSVKVLTRFSTFLKTLAEAFLVAAVFGYFYIALTRLSNLIHI